MLSVRDWLRHRRKISRGFARMNADQIKINSRIGKSFSEFCFISNLIRVCSRKSAANLNSRQMPRVVDTKHPHKAIVA